MSSTSNNPGPFVAPNAQSPTPEVVDTPPPGPQPTTALEVLSWFVILGLTSLLFYSNVFVDRSESEPDPDAPAMEVINSELVGKMFYSMSDFARKVEKDPKKAEELVAQLGDSSDALNSGPLEQRYCAVIATSEFNGPDAAQKLLESIDQFSEESDYKPTERQSRLREIVGNLIAEQSANANFDSSVIPVADRDFLIQQLRWFGRLGLNPAGTPNVLERNELASRAMWTTVVVIVAMVTGILTLGIGVIGLIVALVSFVAGRFVSQTKDQAASGSIYIETFAIWLVLFFGFQIGLGEMVGAFNLGLRDQLFGLLVVFFGSLMVLFWPVMRGISPGKMFDDIGWKFRNPFSEGFYGAFSYASLTPIMGTALVLTVIGAMLFAAGSEGEELAGSGGPVHPIMGHLTSGDFMVIVFIFLSTCVAAPIVEETMFRGVLFRYLRDRTGRWSRFSSVAFAAVFNGLIFASVHPQGLIGIPVLTALAVGFSLVRQWRHSLMAPMIMHALNNFLVTTFAVMVMS